MIVVASLHAKPTPVNDMERNEFAGSAKRGANATLSILSVKSTEGRSGPISFTIPLNVPDALAATVLPLRSIMAADTLENAGCSRVGVEHGPN